LLSSVAGCLFARAGARVVLVEEPDVDLRDLAERYGAATARRIWMRTDARLFTDLLRRLRISAGPLATPEFKPLAGRFRMMNTYVIATPPLPLRVRRDMGLGQVMLWDTERPYHYARWTPDRRLLFGGKDRPKLPRAARPEVLDRRAGSLSAELAVLYPVLTGVTPDYAWKGLFATTSDGLPYVGAHRRYPRQLFALGYGGNGMTFGYLAAELLVRAARGAPAPDDELFGFGRTGRRK
jgi:glycine/D-amino acid oxidase-like deaminating enzyme